MANLSANPWNFVAADQATTAAISSIVKNGIGSVLITTAAAHGIVQDQNFSIQGTTTGWNGRYRAIAVPSTTTILANIPPQFMANANGGAAGSVFSMIYDQDVEVDQMLWDSPTVNTSLLLTDGSGTIVWNPTSVTGGTLTYMKCHPIFGLVLNTIGSGTLQISR